MKWAEESKSIHTAQELCRVLGKPEEEQAKYEAVLARFPMRIPQYYLDLIDKTDPEDPIGKMCLPDPMELEDSGSFDTSGERDNTKQTGVQHKYPQTALILSTNACAMYCRHCFRKRLVGLSDSELNKQVDEAAAYVRQHPEINNVLISGGDALMNANHIIRRYLEELCTIPHLDFIRFGSRVPVTWPQRVNGDPELLELFARYGREKTLYIITQFNHPREVTPAAARAVRAFLERGVQVRNQTVLLRGVNDRPEVLGKLLNEMTRIGAVPYYIFQCRPVTGVKSRFQVPLARGIEVIDHAKDSQSGLGKNLRYSLSHPRGKIEILGKPDGDKLLFKFHQSKFPADSARIFTTAYSATATWLDENLQPI